MGIAISAFVQKYSPECKVTLPMEELPSKPAVKVEVTESLSGPSTAEPAPDFISPEYFNQVISTFKHYATGKAVTLPTDFEDDNFDDYESNVPGEPKSWTTLRTRLSSVTVKPPSSEVIRWIIKLLLLAILVPLIGFILFQIFIVVAMSQYQF